MYYVAKLYNHCTPNIVESFNSLELAQSYANIMNCANKGTYVVLTKVESE